MAVNLEDVVKLAEQLDSDQQNLLIYRLRVKQLGELAIRKTAVSSSSRNVSQSLIRDELVQEVVSLRNTPAHAENSLLGSYANSSIPDISEEEFHAQMHSIATEWEQELDELSDDQL